MYVADENNKQKKIRKSNKEVYRRGFLNSLWFIRLIQVQLISYLS